MAQTWASKDTTIKIDSWSHFPKVFLVTSSHLVVSTSDESWRKVFVRFLLASVNARVSSFGLYDCSPEAGAAWVVVVAALLEAVDDDDAGGTLLVEAEETGGREIEVLDLFAALDEELTVDNCSWISIIWSPSRMVRFNGALPLRKSTTCNREIINIVACLLASEVVYRSSHVCMITIGNATLWPRGEKKGMEKPRAELSDDHGNENKQ